ncbi:MAG: tetratricopeptide repeat protein [Luteimonas sp.]|nr:tetratricopeptide repeat protein [Luteimonas sp.]
MLRATLLLLLILLAGTARAWATTPAEQAQAGQAQAAQVQAAMALPDELRQALPTLELDHLSRLDRVRRLFEFMIAKEGLALRYREQPTYDIAESYARREVNCLSFTMMFIALARAAEVDAYAQVSEDTLAMHLVDDTLLRAKHVKAGIDVDHLQYTVDVGWRSVVAERRPRQISDAQLVALLHNNNAVEDLQRGNGAAATSEITVALALDPDNAMIWSNAGVIHLRSGRRDAAERAYLRALDLERNQIAALGNLVGLYRATGATRLAAKYDGRLQRAQASDPFSQFLIAQSLMDSGAYDMAASHYRRAIRLLPNQPQFHRSLADAYERVGKDRAAQRARDQALSLERRRDLQRSIPEVRPGTG